MKRFLHSPTSFRQLLISCALLLGLSYWGVSLVLDQPLVTAQGDNQDSVDVNATVPDTGQPPASNEPKEELKAAAKPVSDSLVYARADLVEILFYSLLGFSVGIILGYYSGKKRGYKKGIETPQASAAVNQTHLEQ